MEIFNLPIIDRCVAKHASARKAMNRFVKQLEKFKGNSHTELLAVFPSADYVRGNRYVFDIQGNHFRVVCIIIFIDGSAFVRFAGTHAEYNKMNASKI